MGCLVLRPFTIRRLGLRAFCPCKPCQQRQDDDGQNGKENHFPDNMQQKRHGGPLPRVVAVCRSSISPIIRRSEKCPPEQPAHRPTPGGPSYREAKGGNVRRLANAKTNGLPKSARGHPAQILLNIFLDNERKTTPPQSSPCAPPTTASRDPPVGWPVLSRSEGREIVRLDRVAWARQCKQ